MDVNARPRVPDGLVRLTSFLANSMIAGIFLFSAILGLQVATTEKFTTDAFGPGLMNRYRVLPMSGSTSRAEFQYYYNYEVLMKSGLFSLIAGPFFLALGSYELWARRINDAARARGTSLKASYGPRLRRCYTAGAAVSQALVIVLLALLGLAATYLATFGAWMVEDNNQRAGLSFPLSGLNKTLYYGGVVPEDAVDVTAKDLSSSDWFHNAVLEIWEKGLIHPANPPISYYALYPGDALDIPDDMRKTAYYLPRSSFSPLQDYLLQSSREETGMSGPAPLPNANTTSKGIRLGDAIYPYLNTFGVGINMTSYERFVGDGMPGLPRDFVFAGMAGEVYGNAVNVQCLDITNEYHLSTNQTIAEGEIPITYYTFSKTHMSDNEEEHHFSVPSTSASGPLIFAHLSLSGKKPLSFSFPGEQEEQLVFTNVPLQTLFIIPEAHRTSSAAPDPPVSLVFKCIYMPSEYGVSFGVLSDSLESTPKRPLPGQDNSRAGPLQFSKSNYFRRRSTPTVRCISPIYALPAVRAVHELLTNPNPVVEGKHNNTAAGGVLREVLEEYYQRHPPTPGYGRWQTRNARFLRENVMQPVLSSTASAYFSLLRQRVEIANIWFPMLDFTGGVPMPLDEMGPVVTEDVLVKAAVFWILRVGGAAPYRLSYLGVLVLFVIGMCALMNAYRTVVFGRGERFFGRWWERDLATAAPGEVKKKDREVEVEGGNVIGNSLEPLLEKSQDTEGEN
ncbi:hypothetical protein V8F20_012794 [Naviculisporaceae sp. PSN 640]